MTEEDTCILFFNFVWIQFLDLPNTVYFPLIKIDSYLCVHEAPGRMCLFISRFCARAQPDLEHTWEAA